jgi:hypothetical protein
MILCHENKEDTYAFYEQLVKILPGFERDKYPVEELEWLITTGKALYI